MNSIQKRRWRLFVNGAALECTKPLPFAPSLRKRGEGKVPGHGGTGKIRLGATLMLLWAVLLSGSMAQPVGPGETPGVPWTGQPGVTETVGQIMARDAQFAQAGRSARPRETHHRLVPQRARQHNP